MSCKPLGAIEEMCINVYGLRTVTPNEAVHCRFYAFKNTAASHFAMDKSALIALVITALLLRSQSITL